MWESALIRLKSHIPRSGLTRTWPPLLRLSHRLTNIFEYQWAHFCQVKGGKRD